MCHTLFVTVREKTRGLLLSSLVRLQVNACCRSTFAIGARNFCLRLFRSAAIFNCLILAGLGYGLGLGFWVVFTTIVSLTLTLTVITTVTVILPEPQFWPQTLPNPNTLLTLTINVTLTLTLTITLTQIITLTETVILNYNPANELVENGCCPELPGTSVEKTRNRPGSITVRLINFYSFYNEVYLYYFIQ